MHAANSEGDARSLPRTRRDRGNYYQAHNNVKAIRYTYTRECVCKCALQPQVTEAHVYVCMVCIIVLLRVSFGGP